MVTYHSWFSAQVELKAMARLAAERTDVQWCFVDNSDDASDAAKLRTALHSSAAARVITLPNPGFAAGCNAAVASSEARWVMILNPDVMIGANELNAVVERLQHLGERETLAVSMITRGRRHGGIALVRPWWFVDAAIDSPRVLGPSGGAGVYPRELYREFGGLWEPLFAWGEDADLAWRLHRDGVPCSVLDLGLGHAGGHSLSGGSASQAFKVGLLYRNRVWVARRNLDPIRYVAFMVCYASAVLVLSLRNARRGALLASYRGYLIGLRTARPLR